MRLIKQIALCSLSFICALGVITGAGIVSAHFHTKTSDTIFGQTMLQASEKKEDEFSYKKYKKYKGEIFTVVNEDLTFFKDGEVPSEDKIKKLDKYGRAKDIVYTVSVKNIPEEEPYYMDKTNTSGYQFAVYDKKTNYQNLYTTMYMLDPMYSGTADDNTLITLTQAAKEGFQQAASYEIRDFLKDNDNMDVQVRITPIFKGKEALCRGVLVEAASVQDQGRSFHLCRFVYNVQDGIEIDYMTGDSSEI